MRHTDTIVAIATPPGRGGVAIVRISGEGAFRVASAVCGRPFTCNDAGRFFRVTMREGRGVICDDGVALVFAAPHSYTGEDVIELQGHGGRVAPRRVLEACLAAGARLANRGEFTLRAFLNGRLDLTAAEGVMDLVDARNARSADVALVRLQGRVRMAYERVYEMLVALSAACEHALDISEDELPEGYADVKRAEVVQVAAEITRLLATAREGKMLRDGALVVLAGKPNAGKSSLMNALLGENRAIVSPMAGTTRDVIEEGAEIGGWPVRLADTAGLRETDDVVESEGVSRARALLAEADVIVALDCDFPGAIRVHAKCDLDASTGDVPEGLPVSTKSGAGLNDLRSAIAARLDALSAHGDEKDGADVTTRERSYLECAARKLQQLTAAEGCWDWVIAANLLREAAEAIAEMLGKTYHEDMLTALFSRFCVGK